MLLVELYQKLREGKPFAIPPLSPGTRPQIVGEAVKLFWWVKLLDLDNLNHCALRMNREAMNSRNQTLEAGS